MGHSSVSGCAIAEQWRGFVNSNRVSPLEKNAAMRVATGCCWTASALADKGYPVSPFCPLGCGQFDTVFHR
eukprot:155550-Lingulodinium_polyedra.AAC.1